MGYLNENKRVANQANDYDKITIFKDGKELLNGDKTSVAVVWNNLIGANMPDQNTHNYYLSFLKGQDWGTGLYSILGDGNIIIHQVDIEFP